MNKNIDITWASNEYVEMAIDDICRSLWEVGSDLSKYSITITKSHNKYMKEQIAKEINYGKPIYDKRTKGGKWLQRETNLNPKNMFYESDFGVIKIHIDHE